jgi:hypothetical protein
MGWLDDGGMVVGTADGGSALMQAAYRGFPD